MDLETMEKFNQKLLRFMIAEIIEATVIEWTKDKNTTFQLNYFENICRHQIPRSIDHQTLHL